MDRIGKYEVLDQIGSGGFATVFKGYDPFIKRPVAIKICYSRDAETRQRFHREAEIAGSLVHRNITLVHDFGLHDENPYLIEEYLSGEDLAHLVRRKEPDELVKKIELLAQIASGLEYAHAQGVIHRDIKPGNIRVLESGQVKIMDFGTAKLAHVESHLTQAGMTLGTVAYLSPERLLGQPAGLNSDIFSYGVMAYELLSFRRPFGGRNIPHLIDQVLNAAPVHLTDAWPECPPALGEIVHRCLHKDPEVRFASCTEVLAELEGVMLDLVGGQTGPTFFNEPSTTVPVPQPNLQVTGLLERARQLLARERYSRAAVMLEEVLEMAPDNTEALQLMASCQAVLEGSPKAEESEPASSTGFVWEGPEERRARKRGEAVDSIERYIDAGELIAAVEALKFANQLFGPIEDAPGLQRRAMVKAKEQLVQLKSGAVQTSRFVVDQMIRLRQSGRLGVDLAHQLAGWADELDPENLTARDLLTMVENQARQAPPPTRHNPTRHNPTQPNPTPPNPTPPNPTPAPVSASAQGTNPAPAAVEGSGVRKRREAVASIETLLSQGDAATAAKALDFALNLYGDFDQAPSLRRRIEDALEPGGR